MPMYKNVYFHAKATGVTFSILSEFWLTFNCTESVAQLFEGSILYCHVRLCKGCLQRAAHSEVTVQSYLLKLLLL